MSTHTQNEKQESGGMNRRAFMRRGAAGAVAVGGLAYAKPPVQNAQAFPPALVAAGGIAAGAAVGYTTRYVQDYLTGDDIDKDAYDESNKEEVYNGIRESCLTIKNTDETVLTTIENNISSGQNAAFSEAKKAAIEQLNLDNGETAAVDAAKDANNDYWSIPQENLARHFSQQMAIIENNLEAEATVQDFGWFEIAERHEDGGDTTSFRSSIIDFPTSSVTFKNGDTYAAMEADYTSDFDDVSFSLTSSNDWARPMLKSDYDKNGFEVFNGFRYNDIWDEISQNHGEVEANIETWVPAVAEEYESGDISLADVVSPSDIANNAADSDGFAYAGADLASLGLSSIGGNWDIRLEESDVVVRGTIYLLTDETLTTGQTYSPDNIAGPVYLAYEWEDGQFGDEPAGSDLVALEQDFTILGGTAGEWVDGEDGDRVYETETIGEGEEINFSETYQSTTDTDIESFREELQTLRERNEELEEQQREAAGVGGSFADDAQGFLSSEIYGIPVIGWAIGLAGAGILFGGND